ncbi:MAG: dockerin type I repeat-containing protein, partial [Candidatus Zixiibacteriota bacterium]
MMFKRFYAVMLICVFLLSVAQMVGAEEKGQAIKIMKPISITQPPTDKDGYCVLYYDADWSSSWYSGNTQAGTGVYTYYNPADPNYLVVGCDYSPWPFEITAFSFTLIADTANTWPVSIDIIVREMVNPSDIMQGPGEEICRYSMVANEAEFSGHSGMFNFPKACCVDGPFFIGIEYQSGVEGSTPSFVMSGDETVPNGYMWGLGYSTGNWYEWHDFFAPPPIPGWLAFMVYGEPNSNCEGVTCSWEEEDPHKMHFPQLPDLTGWEIGANDWEIILADDWQCSETGDVKDIHFWGSWKYAMEDFIYGFQLTIHADIPADSSPSGFSMPGDILWSKGVVDFEAVHFFPQLPQKWYDPNTEEIIEGNAYDYYQYNICLDSADWFHQDSGTVYWLEIIPATNEPYPRAWGWKSSQDHFLDNAVYRSSYTGWDWQRLNDPFDTLQSIDFAFVITGEASETCMSGDINDDGIGPNIQDVSYLLNYLVKEGPPPSTPANADVNGDGRIDQNDAVYLIRYLYLAGNPPVQCTPGSNPTPDFSPMACCLPDGACTEDLLSCIFGTVQPLGTTCQGDYDDNGTDDLCEETPGACCMPSGQCLEMSALECILDSAGTFQGAGTQCTAPEACVLPGNDCAGDLDPLCCLELGGTPQGPGTSCYDFGACCASDGNCLTTDRWSCLSLMSGTFMGDGTTCDANTCNAFQPQACCLPDGGCVEVSTENCESMGGVPQGEGSECLGDLNGDGADDACGQPTWSNHKMHYPQLPDESGWDVRAPNFAGMRIGDDWRCSESGYVKDIHFWGSWKNGIEGIVIGWTIEIYSDVPAGDTVSYSRPGQKLWSKFINPGEVPISSSSWQGWYSPYEPLTISDHHQGYIRYDITLNQADWFLQEEGTIYWLTVYPVILVGGEWGWKSSIHSFNDDAVWGTDNNWNEMFEPPDFNKSLNLAFVITGDPPGPDAEACCLPNNTCTEVDPATCTGMGGTPQGPGTVCLGDANSDGMDDACVPVDIGLVYIDVGLPGVEAPVDELEEGVEYEFRIWLQNS